MEDPFFVVRQEVQKALNVIDDLHNRWQQLINNSDSFGKEEYTWVCNEIRNNIKSIEWDLEDLTETVSIVELNPSKFDLSSNDIAERKAFIKGTQSKITLIKADINKPEINTKIEKENRKSLIPNKTKKYERLDNEIINSNQSFIAEQFEQQQILVSQQDSQLEHVSHSVGVLKSMGRQIGDELDDQAIILDELGHDIEQTNSKLQTVLLRVEKMLRLSDDKKQTYVLIGLIVTLIIVVILFCVL